MQANMENSPFERIEQYLEGSMSSAEKTEFESHLNEPSWGEELQSYKTLTGGIRSVQRHKMLRHLQSVDDSMSKYEPESEPIAVAEGKTRPLLGGGWKNELYYWVAAACILALLIPGYYFIQDQKTEKLFTQYFSPHQAGATLATPSEEVMREYREGDYAQALHLLITNEKSLTENDTTILSTLFYKGNMFLATQKPKDAIVCFEKILKDPSDRYRKESEWYLSLSYLKDNKPEQAKKLLKNIVTDAQNSHQKEAEAILKKL
jgi:hypothetical protein